VRVLVACEFSGIVRDAFATKGHDAWSCDLLPTERPGNHIQDDVLKHLDKGWDMMIAHPPCTYLSNAGANSLFKGRVLNQERFEKGLEGKEFFMRFLDAPIPKICVENPVPSSIFKLPRPSQVIQPWEFGDEFSKKTYIWLKGLPPLMATCLCANYEPTTKAAWYQCGGKDRQKRRAKTFQGIADAMADQWGSVAAPSGKEDGK